MSQEIPPEIRSEIEQACEAVGVTLIDLVVRGQHRQLKLEVLIDAEGGITHDHCRAVSRALDDRLSEDEFYDGLRAVDVSSPGADAPVKFLWQLKKSVGRTVRVVKVDGTVVEGSLVNVDDSHLDLQPKSTKKDPKPLASIPSGEVKEARVVIVF